MSAISFGAEAPIQWYSLSEADRSNSLLSGEQCEIEADGRRSFYVRACLDIPIRGSSQPFTWGVWCSLSEKSYAEMMEHWEDPARDQCGPYFGWLCTSIPGYPDTIFLKTMVHQRHVGQRPLVELEPTEHPLAVDQRNGVEVAQLRKLATDLLHADGS